MSLLIPSKRRPLTSMARRDVVLGSSVLLYLPLHDANMSVTSFASRDQNARTCTVTKTGATWNRKGWTFDGTAGDKIAISPSLSHQALQLVFWHKNLGGSHSYFLGTRGASTHDGVEFAAANWLNFSMNDNAIKSTWRPNLTDSLWHHIAIWMAGASAMENSVCYVDGSLQTLDSSANGIPIAWDRLEVGLTNGSTDNGVIDEMIVDTSQWSAGQILQHRARTLWRYTS